jgi:ABC-2 type transport system permease protein
MSARRTAATAARVVVQLRRDPRTVVLLLAVPAALVSLLRYAFDGSPGVFQHIGAPLLGLFPFVSMFLVTSITMLRERRSGTLERLLTLPLAKLELLTGYAAAFALVAAAQAAVVAAVAYGLLDLHTARPASAVALLALANAELGMALGLLVSAFARTEFQAVQFMPAFVLPQLLLCGLLVPRAEMARPLELASDALPLTYAYDALARMAGSAPLGGRFAVDLAVTLGASLVALALGALTLRRRTA